MIDGFSKLETLNYENIRKNTFYDRDSLLNRFDLLSISIGQIFPIRDHFSVPDQWRRRLRVVGEGRLQHWDRGQAGINIFCSGVSEIITYVIGYCGYLYRRLQKKLPNSQNDQTMTSPHLDVLNVSGKSDSRDDCINCYAKSNLAQDTK